MHRRTFLAAGASAAAITLIDRAAAQVPAGTTPAAPAAAPGDAKLTQVFDQVLGELVSRNPEFATSLGFDKGPNAALRGKLGDNSLAAAKQDVAWAKTALARVRAVAPASLSASAKIDRDVVLYNMEQNISSADRFDMERAGSPYRISQQDGAYFGIPDFLNSTHPVNDAADADAYLTRLEQFGQVLDNDTEAQRAQAPRGLLAPVFSVDLAIGQLEKLRAPAPAQSGLVESLVTRAQKAKLTGDYGTRAAKLVAEKVYPALDRQIALMKQLRPSARTAAGIGAIPRGQEIYALALANATTTDFKPDEVHKMGLDQVADLSAQLDSILKAQGMSQGTLGARLATLNASPAQLYPDTAEGRTAMIADLNASAQAMQAKLGRAFNDPPNKPLEIHAVPENIQDGAANGYYYRAPLDGSRPAIYWINLKSVGDWPKYSLPSLTYHEGVPGHHLQISIAQGADTHVLRKISFFGAYTEGWALYAEQLSDELQGYATPLERAGYLQSFLFRAARLVVDTGIHTKGWSREQATQYLVDNVGFAQPRSQREVERYCVSPGQACSYKLGHAAWLRARDNAKKILGDRFDVKTFHDVLVEGAVPLTLLEQRVEARANALKA